MRPRNRKNSILPPNLYSNGARAWKYRRPDTGTWHGLGTDKTRAISAAKQLNSLFMQGSDIVAAVMGASQSVANFINQYKEEILPPRKLAESTLYLYSIRLRQFEEFVGPDKALDSVTILNVSNFLDSLPTRSSNQARKIIVDLFAHAAAKGLVPDNPAANTLAKIDEKKRRRHTIEGLRKIRAHSPVWLQNAIDLSLITTQAREEILNMKFADIREGNLQVVRKKTQKTSDAAFVSMRVTPELDAVIQRCRDNILSPYLIHRKPDRITEKRRKAKEHPTKIEPNYLTHAFQEARTAANAYPSLKPEELPGFHEIRALALHLYKKAGKPIEERKKLAAHAHEKTTTNYEADHEEIVWTKADPDLDIRGIFGDNSENQEG